MRTLFKESPSYSLTKFPSNRVRQRERFVEPSFINQEPYSQVGLADLKRKSVGKIVMASGSFSLVSFTHVA